MHTSRLISTAVHFSKPLKLASCSYLGSRTFFFAKSLGPLHPVVAQLSASHYRVNSNSNPRIPGRMKLSTMADKNYRTPETHGDKGMPSGASSAESVLRGAYVEKPLTDDRLYRVITLPNQLEALLIQDSTTDQASAALNVNVGSFSDSSDLYGLAHFCEHLLFMGTEKYPEENAYSQYLSEHSGHSNAYTSSDETNYYFEVSHEYLEGALDRFAQFFISPLFLPDCKDREIQAVDSENKKNLQSDVWRLRQLDKLFSNQEHPFSNFSTGNLQTLQYGPAEKGIDVREELLKFYHKHYSSNIMKLVIIGRESLDTLENWTLKKFSLVKNVSATPPYYEAPPFTNDHLGLVVKARPVKDTKNLFFTFPVPDQRPHYEVKPAHYFSHLIGHEGKGSLLLLLKSMEMATGLSSGIEHISKGYEAFSIDVVLTKKGVKEYKTVINYVFQYIAMLRATPPQKWIFDELKTMAAIEFKYREKAGASHTTMRLASIMQREGLPRDKLLSFSLMTNYDEKLLKKFVSYLTPDNFKALLAGQDLEGLDQKEKWYGTEYAVEHISEEFIKQLGSTLIDERLHIPSKNEFIPENFSVDKKEVDTPVKHPSLIRRDDAIIVWHKKDDSFWVPKARVYIKIQTPATNVSPRSLSRSLMIVELLNESLVEYAYDAEVAGLRYSVSLIKGGIEVVVSGFNDKINVLLKRILSTIKSYVVDEGRFRILKEASVQMQHDIGYAVPYQQLSERSFVLLAENAWNYECKEQELKKLQVTDVQSYIPEILQSFQLEVLAVGNITKPETLEIAQMTQSILSGSPLYDLQKIPLRAYTLPEGSSYYYKVPLKDDKDVNSAIEYYMQICPMTDKWTRVVLDVLAQIGHEPVFTRLRTQEQLGYIVFSGVKVVRGIVGYRFLVQSEKTTEYLERRIVNFLRQLGSVIEKLSDEDFKSYVEAIVSRNLQKFKNLKEEASKYWSNIQSGYYDFLGAETDVELLRKVTKEDVLKLYREFIDPRSEKAAKLVVHLQSQCSPSEIIDSVITASIVNHVLDLGMELNQAEMLEMAQKCQDKELPGVLEIVKETLISKDVSEPAAIEICASIQRDVALTIDAHLSKVSEGEEIKSVGQFKAQQALCPAPLPVFDLSVYEDSVSKL